MKKLQNLKVLYIQVALAGRTTSFRYPFIPADLTSVGFSHLCTFVLVVKAGTILELRKCVLG